MLKNGPQPKYYQLAAILRQQINTQQLRSNDQLPPEDALCRTHEVSRGTVREAIRLLLEEGLIRREQGRGTFVNAVQPESTLFTLSNFAADMRRQNRHASSRILQAEVIPAATEVAHKLDLPVDEPVLLIVRLRLADGQPVVYETRYLALTLCPDLLDEDLERASIHRLLIEKYQIPMVRMTHTVEICHLSAKQAQLLQTQPGSTAFAVDRLTYTSKHEQKIPAVWYRAFYREDNYNFKVQFQASL